MEEIKELDREELKCVIVGDAAVGKTKLILELIKPNSYEEVSNHSTWETYNKNLDVDGRQFNVMIQDTGSQDEFANTRSKYYHNAQIILICFSLISSPSFQSVEQKWIKEIKNTNPNVPILLIGTKLDLRNNEKMVERLKDKNMHPISGSEGLETCKKIVALGYFEISVEEDKNALQKVFTDAIKLVFDPPSTKKKKKKLNCLIM
eukprot:TRINITY_DN3011_c0_g1_i2.p1 TRINITY_DN3011_c0_g1~~TRINITY_DN3011_c0_g1_i2.p1  ORF type:complete len:205 (-),score=45.17 TRINITY_DN3011_c0_g1_i2:83-697(-)